MKITVITRNLSAGGAERVIVQLLNEWKENNECNLVLIDDCEDFYELDNDIWIIRIGRQASNNVVDKLMRYYKLRKVIKRQNPDVVLSLPEEIGIYVIASLLGTKYPVIVSERNNPWKMPYKKVTRVLRQILYPFAKGIIFQTKGAASFFNKKIQQKGIVLPNPLDLGRIPEHYKGNRDKIIVSVGRFEEQKNFKLLIDAFYNVVSKYNDYKLVIFGEGSLYDNLNDYASKLLPSGSWEFPGNDNNVLKKINSAACFVSSSDYEGVPNVLIEAMAMGIPCISTDCEPGGARELITNGYNGYLTPIGDCNELSRNIKMVLEMDSHEVNYICENAMMIINKVNSKVVAKQWLCYIENNLNKRN